LFRCLLEGRKKVIRSAEQAFSLGRCSDKETYIVHIRSFSSSTM